MGNLLGALSSRRVSHVKITFFKFKFKELVRLMEIQLKDIVKRIWYPGGSESRFTGNT